MKFTSLHLEKYGAYENRTLTLRPDASLHLIVGANEAGKTSALSAIGDLLFGFSSAKKKFDFKFEAGSLRLGAALQLRDGGTLNFRRRRGRKNVIVDAQDKAIGDDLLDPVTGSLTRQAFEQEFGLTAERLRAGGEALLAADGALAESLAAGSAELSALNQLKSELQKNADDLFTSRKVASKEFYTSAAHYSDTTKSLREAIVSAQAVEDAEALCSETLAEANRLEEDHKTVTRDLTRLQRAKNTRGKLAQFAEADEKLAALSSLPDIEPAALKQWQNALTQQAQIETQLADVQTRLTAVSDSLLVQQADPMIAAAASEIEQLREDFGAAEKARSDLPNREKERHATWLQLEAQARELGLSSPDVLLEKMPKRPLLARVAELVRNQRDLDIRRTGLRESLEAAKKRLAALQQQESGNVHAADPAPLAQALDSFSSIPADATLLRQQQADLDQSLVDLQRRCDRLQPPAPLLEDLVHLALPDAAAIDAIRREWDETARTIKQLHSDIDAAQSEQVSIEQKLARLASKGVIATREDLQASRAGRDAAVGQLEQAKTDSGKRQSAIAAIREANLKLDNVTDSLLEDSERAAAKWQLEQELSRAIEAVQRYRDHIDAAETARDAADASWHDIWAASGIEPLAPDVMVKWLSSVSDIVDRYDRLSNVRSDIAAQKDKLGELEPALLALLPKLDAGPARGLPIADVYNLARKALGHLQDKWNARRENAGRLDGAAAEIKDVEAQIKAVTRSISDQQADWIEAMTGVGLSGDTGAAEASAALDIWTQAIAARDKYQGEDYRVSTIGQDIEAFQARLAEICARLAPDLDSTDARRAVEALAAKLLTTRRANDEIQRLTTEHAAIEKQIGTLNQQRAATQAVLLAGAELLGLDDLSADPSAIRKALDTLQQHSDTSAALMALKNDIASMAEGTDIETLRNEQADIDFDAIDGEVERLSARAGRLIEDIKEAAVRQQDARRAFETLTAGSNAATLAQQKQEAAADLLDISRRWLVRATAARLASQTIEKHRQSAQDPVIARTSTLFAHATAGVYQGLGVQFGNDDQLTFAAVRAGGDFVPISGLSDGTRDQLFLALRLALLEQRSGEPLPFIGDDILTSFDETRTAQALGMLAEFGQNRQTILFSHHRHVAEIAAERLGSALDLIDL